MARNRSSSRHAGLFYRLVRSVKNFVRSFWVAFVAIAATVIALNHLGAINWTLDVLGRSHIAESNTVYLHKAKQEMAETIVTLTGLDTGLEVLKSSTVGGSFIVSFHVQIGNIVATVQDAAKKALKASLIAASSLLAIELILKFAETLSVPLVTLSILATGLHYTTRQHLTWVARVTGQLSEILILLMLLTHIGLPLAIYGSSIASKSITAPIAEQAREHFEKTSDRFPKGDKGKLEKHMKDAVNKYQDTASTDHHSGRLLSHSVVRHVTAIVFDVFLFPAMMFALVTWVIRMMIRHALRVQELMAEDEARKMQAQSARHR